MRLSARTIVFTLLICCCVTLPVLAQDDCVANVEETLESVLKACADTDISEVCYGSGAIVVVSRGDDLAWEEPGDKVNAAEVEQLTLLREAEPLSVAVIRTRAALPDSGLTMVAFGEVQLHNASDRSADFVALDALVTSATGANVRAEPSPDSELVVQLLTGQQVTAVGRTKDAAWIRLTEGWVSAALLSMDHDWSVLEVVDADTDIAVEDGLFTPMQAFEFRSAVDDAPCTQEPDSGILFQRPDTTGESLLQVNHVTLSFSGTLYMQSPVTGELFISVLEGDLRVGDNLFQAGDRLEWTPHGKFVGREDYHYVRLRYLPLTLLPRSIDLAFSLGGLAEPYISGSLTNVERDDPCMVAWIADVNLRGGPGSDYPLRHGVPAYFSAHPDGQATGTDGVIWWRLAENVWVQSGVVYAAGACVELPVVPVPPLPESGD